MDGCLVYCSYLDLTSNVAQASKQAGFNFQF